MSSSSPHRSSGSGARYDAALRAITERGRYGVRLGLERVEALLHELGDPQRDLRGALIAGTNGKGSVLAMLSSALREAGLRVGETPKPHLVTYRERMQVDGRLVDPSTFARLAADALAAAERIDPSLGPATEFELVTAMIFRWFADERVDVALVEVGLGGRLDATHAWDGGVAVITNVALDHTEQLGPTVEAIAREKAAIIEPGDLAVTGATGPALGVIRERATEVGVPLRVVPPARLLGQDRHGIEVELPRLGRTRIGLLGRHQASNVAVADATLDALEAAGIASADADARRRGYARARWSGRLELVDAGGRDVLLDGAHNPAGAASLATALDDLRPELLPGPPAPIVLLTATMGDKDVDGIVSALATARSLRGARILATTLPLERAMPAGELAARWRANGFPAARVEAVDDVEAALDRALAVAAGPVVVAGSLYLVGAVRARLVDDPALRDPGTDG